MSEKTVRIPSTSPAIVASDSKVLNYATRVVVILVAVGAAVLSFDALTELAKASGIRAEFAWIWAVVIDGFILVATFATFALQNRGKGSRYYAWSTLALFVIFSILGNAWHAAIAKTDFELPLGVAVIVTAVPPLALFLAIHLLVIMVSPTKEQKEELQRQAAKRERLRKIEERELEKIERESVAREAKEAARQLRNEEAVVPYQPKVKPVAVTSASTFVKPVVETPKPLISPVAEKPNPLSSPATQQNVTTEAPQITLHKPETIKTDNVIEAVEVAEANDADEVLPTKTFLTEEEVLIMMQQTYDEGKPLPSGKVVAGLLGKSDRTGQNIVRKFKLSLEA
jgi:hypothetical protein